MEQGTDSIAALVATLGGPDGTSVERQIATILSDADGATVEQQVAATLSGPDGAAIEQHIATLPVERAVELGVFLARCEPALNGVRTAARAVAERIYRTLRPLAGRTMKLTDDLAQLALVLGHADEAAAMLRERLAASEALTAYQWLARACVALDDREQGDALAERLRAYDGPRVTAWLALGDLALAFEGAAPAAAIFRRALQIAPNGVSARLGLARCAAAEGDAEAAREQLARVFAGYGDAPPAWVLHETRTVAARLGDSEWEAEMRNRLAAGDAHEAARLLAALPGATGTPGAAPRARGGAFATLSVATARASTAPLAEEEDTPDDGDTEPTAAPEDEEPADPALVEALREAFGYEGFLPGQATIVRATMAGEDVLALMPTGAGKSLCYQLPAMLLTGTTVLISPLIALMKDQIDGLPEELRARTTVINSLVERDEIERRLAGIAAGRYALVYAAPERLRQQSFLYALRRGGVARFVVDEAHCVSLWGHDFRPDYLFIAKALRQLERGRARVPVLALTATATPTVRRGIAEALGRELRIVNRGVFRPNLRYEVVAAANNEARKRELARILAETPGSAIVYVRSRDGCEEVAEFLRRRCRIAALHYHAGMERAEREAAQDAFIAGRARVVVATVAFGMGIDKPDVRCIVHYQLPGSLEAYVQESGRAGRDGKPSRCVLFASPADASALRRHVTQDEISIETLRAVYAAARALVRASAPDGGAQLGRVAAGELERDIAQAFQASGRQVDETASRVALSLLERAGFILRHADVPRAPVVRLVRTPTPARGDSGDSGDADETRAFPVFAEAAALRPGQPQALNLVALAARLALDPAELEERLLAWRDAGLIEYREGGRDLLLEISPPPPDGRETLPALLDQMAERHDRQVADLLAYTGAMGCRQRLIARHFGERLRTTSCGVCDRCAPPTNASRNAPTERAPRAPRPVRIRDEQALRGAIVACLRELPYAVGVSGLVKILRGSEDVGAAARRSAQYGTLAGASAAQLNRTLLAMVDEGLLERDAAAEYPTLRLHAGVSGSGTDR
ncbi:MAG: RecQ family ATP-dependent DNA helicase [Ktedonobacterales bacterium]